MTHILIELDKLKNETEIILIESYSLNHSGHIHQSNEKNEKRLNLITEILFFTQ